MQMCPECGGIYDESDYARCPDCYGYGFDSYEPSAEDSDRPDSDSE